MAKEKIGNDTLQRYQTYLKEEKYKDAFKEFNYYFNEFDPKDQNNSTEKKLFNPHLDITTNYNNGNSIVKANLPSSRENLPSNLETKFSKLKQMSSSCSSKSMLRHYRNSSGNNFSNNSTSSSQSLTNNANPMRNSGPAATFHS